MNRTQQQIKAQTYKGEQLKIEKKSVKAQAVQKILSNTASANMNVYDKVAAMEAQRIVNEIRDNKAANIRELKTNQQAIHDQCKVDDIFHEHLKKVQEIQNKFTDRAIEMLREDGKKMLDKRRERMKQQMESAKQEREELTRRLEDQAKLNRYKQSFAEETMSRKTGPSKNDPILQQLQHYFPYRKPAISPGAGLDAFCGPIPKDLWTHHILPLLDIRSLLSLENACRYFRAKLTHDCRCGSGFQLASDCDSIWARHARRINYEHKRFGNDLSCRIFKRIQVMTHLEEEAPRKLQQLYQMYCQKGYHILKKKKKKSKMHICELCLAEVSDCKNQKEVCGFGGDKQKMCPRHKEFLCEYPSQHYTHKCYCLLCNKASAELAQYFFRVKPMIVLSKSNFKSRDPYLIFVLEL